MNTDTKQDTMKSFRKALAEMISTTEANKPIADKVKTMAFFNNLRQSERSELVNFYSNLKRAHEEHMTDPKRVAIETDGRSTNDPAKLDGGVITSMMEFNDFAFDDEIVQMRFETLCSTMTENYMEEEGLSYERS